jgi:hypothetical protein
LEGIGYRPTRYGEYFSVEVYGVAGGATLMNGMEYQRVRVLIEDNGDVTMRFHLSEFHFKEDRGTVAVIMQRLWSNPCEPMEKAPGNSLKVPDHTLAYCNHSVVITSDNVHAKNKALFAPPSSTPGDPCSGLINNDDSDLNIDAALTQSAEISFPAPATVNGTLVVGREVDNQTFTVTICDDTFFEADEYIRMTLGSAKRGGQLMPETLTGQDSLITSYLRISDDGDAGTISFKETQYDIREDASEVTVTILRLGGTSQVVTVRYQTKEGAPVPILGTDPAEDNVDYVPVAAPGIMLLFAKGVSERTVVLSVLNDGWAEVPDESFQVVLTDPGGGCFLGNDIATITILDDGDAGSVSWPSPFLKVGEKASTVTVTLTRTSYLYGAFTVYWRTNSSRASSALIVNPALGNADYSAVMSESVTFSPNQRTADVTFTITDDAFYETPDETFALELFKTSDKNVLLTTNGTMTVSILDDSDVTIAFKSSKYKVLENETFVFVTVDRFSSSSRPVTVKYQIDRRIVVDNGLQPAQGSGASPDYDGAYDFPVYDTLVFTAGEKNKTFPVVVIDDDLYESPDEVIGIRLFDCVGCDLDGPFGQKETFVTIMDDGDAGTISFIQSHFQTPESTGMYTITLTRTGGVSTVVSVTIDVSPLPDAEVTFTMAAPTNLEDFEAAEGPHAVLAIFDDQIDVVTYAVRIVQDRQYEFPDEVFKMTMRDLSPAASYGRFPVSYVTILDDGDATFAFAFNTLEVSEAVGIVGITVYRTGFLNCTVKLDYLAPINIGYTPPGITAQPEIPGDLEGESGSLIFLPNVTEMSYNISITQDSHFEADEVALLQLVPLSMGSVLDKTLGNAPILGAKRLIMLTITDDGDAGLLTFLSDTISVKEYNEFVTLTVTRLGGTAGKVSMTYLTETITATPMADYIAVGEAGRAKQKIDFQDGQHVQVVVVAIYDDLVFEHPDELFTVHMSHVSGGAKSYRYTSINVTIADDGQDLGLQFTSAGYAIREDIYSALDLMEVTNHSIINVPNDPYTVRLNTTVIHDLYIGNTVELKGMFCNLTDDTAFEGGGHSNTTTVHGGTVMSTPSKREVVVSFNRTKYKTIAAPHGKLLESNAAPYIANCTMSGFVQIGVRRINLITITRTGYAKPPVTVIFEASGTTEKSPPSIVATEFEDFIPVPKTTLRFKAYETKKTIEVKILNDFEYERLEQIKIKLSDVQSDSALILMQQPVVQTLDAGSNLVQADNPFITQINADMHYSPSGIESDWTSDAKLGGGISSFANLTLPKRGQNYQMRFFYTAGANYQLNLWGPRYGDHLRLPSYVLGGDLTMSLWLYAHNTSRFNAPIFDFGGGAGQTDNIVLGFDNNTGGMSFFVYGEKPAAPPYGSAPNAWMHRDTLYSVGTNEYELIDLGYSEPLNRIASGTVHGLSTTTEAVSGNPTDRVFKTVYISGTTFYPPINGFREIYTIPNNLTLVLADPSNESLPLDIETIKRGGTGRAITNRFHTIHFNIIRVNISNDAFGTQEPHGLEVGDIVEISDTVTAPVVVGKFAIRSVPSAFEFTVVTSVDIESVLFGDTGIGFYNRTVNAGFVLKGVYPQVRQQCCV